MLNRDFLFDVNVKSRSSESLYLIKEQGLPKGCVALVNFPQTFDLLDFLLAVFY
ncbi:MAG: hypothetical protein AB1589_30360 [Cyanobacteriota bacterium]